MTMAEYIKREATIKAIVDSRNRYYNSASNQYLVGRCDGLDIAAGLLRVAPAADVAPVVRCKDCKHKGWVQEPCHGKSVDYCKVWDCTLRNLETTFCSYGERKDGGDG